MIALIVPSNLKYAPYVQYYIKALDNKKIEYEIITWNRKNLIEEKSNYSFNYYVSDNERKKVLYGYLKFSFFVKKIINRRKYNKLIVFTIGAAFFISDLLLIKYKKKYIFDIRDASIITKKMTYIFKKICHNANSIIVSSKEFNSWIPARTIICHNVDKDMLIKHINDNLYYQKSKINKIVFAGILNEWEINNELINLFANNSKYEFEFIGVENEGKKKLIESVINNNVKNVKFTGTYNKEDIIKIYREKATLVNVIRKESIVNAQAIPNKLYDAVISGIPIIVLKHNLVLAKMTEKYKLGIVINELNVEEIERKIREFESVYLNTGKYYKNRKLFLMQVMKDIEKYEKNISLFITKNEDKND